MTRPRFRFTLRTLLVVVTALAVLFATGLGHTRTGDPTWEPNGPFFVVALIEFLGFRVWRKLAT